MGCVCVWSAGGGFMVPSGPWADTPPGRHPRGQTTPWADTPGVLRDTVNKRVVCIILECILVSSADRLTGFYLSFPSPTTIRFESSYYPGVYLFINEDGVLRAGTPSNDNDVFETLAAGEKSAFRNLLSDCFIAFDSNAEPRTCSCCTSADAATHFTVYWQ